MLSFASYNVPIAQAGPRFKAYLKRKFTCLPTPARGLATNKWLKIRIWHLAEKRVWRALHTLATCKTDKTRAHALLKLMATYEVRNEVYKDAVDAHFRVCRHMSYLLKQDWPEEVRVMLNRHPGFFPPRH